MKLKIFVWIISLCLITTAISLVPGSLNESFAQVPSLSAEQAEQIELVKVYDAQVVQYFIVPNRRLGMPNPSSSKQTFHKIKI